MNKEYSGVYAGKGWSIDWNDHGYWLEMEGVGQSRGPLSKHGPPSQERSAEIAERFYEEWRYDQEWLEEDDRWLENE